MVSLPNGISSKELIMVVRKISWEVSDLLESYSLNKMTLSI